MKSYVIFGSSFVLLVLDRWKIAYSKEGFFGFSLFMKFFIFIQKSIADSVTLKKEITKSHFGGFFNQKPPFLQRNVFNRESV